MEQRVLEIQNHLYLGEYDAAIEKVKRLIVLGYSKYNLQLITNCCMTIKRLHLKQLTLIGEEKKYYINVIDRLIEAMLISLEQIKDINNINKVSKLKEYIDMERRIQNLISALNKFADLETIQEANDVLTIIDQILKERNINDKKYHHYQNYLNKILALLMRTIKIVYSTANYNSKDSCAKDNQVIDKLFDIVLSRNNDSEIYKLKIAIDDIYKIMLSIEELKEMTNSDAYDELLNKANEIRKMIIVAKQKYPNEIKKCDILLNMVSNLLQQVSGRLYEEHKVIIDSKEKDEARKLEVRILDVVASLKPEYDIYMKIAEINYNYGIGFIKDRQNNLAIMALDESRKNYQKAKNKIYNLNQKPDGLIKKITDKQVDILIKLTELGVTVNDELSKLGKGEVPIDENNIDTAIARASELIKSKKYSEALKVLNSIPYNSCNYNLVNLFVQIDLAQSKYNGAENRIYDALKSVTNNDDIISLNIKLIKLYLRTDRFADAFEVLKDLFTKYPNNANVIREFIIYYIVIKDYKAALDLHDKNIELLKSNKKYDDNIHFYLIVKNSVPNNILITNDYLKQQFLDYSPMKCVEELKSINKKTNRCSKIRFIGKYPILMIFKKIQQELQTRIPDERGILDKYIIALDECMAIYNSAPTEMFEVRTISNTKDIVRIVPTGRECHASQKLPSQEEFEFKIEY